ncbi:hypothetical protein SAMN04489867_0425 [Pedococcus dokdonensis]|uniref:Uncharacterized protein n=1 Tax=Pedococcus dokdonensis TaxID=443156 RepID=A0A1H0LWX4_9MICO|nr:hypothetical protein [Pedococcus dokdonensis]SDO72722.1 hypothetical protein SAMN04489867_0425 [Pedococcus dokdonensis]
MTTREPESDALRLRHFRGRAGATFESPASAPGPTQQPPSTRSVRVEGVGTANSDGTATMAPTPVPKVPPLVRPRRSHGRTPARPVYPPVPRVPRAGPKRRGNAVARLEAASELMNAAEAAQQAARSKALEEAAAKALAAAQDEFTRTVTQW